MRTRVKPLGALAALIVLGTSMDAFGFLGFGDSASWKEEVLLHDGKIIIAERKQTYGNKPTLDSRERALIEEEWVFPIPAEGKSIVWKTNFRNPPEGESLMLMLVGFIGDVPYLATSPAGCIAYNHWGRPNPPYVFFRYDGAQWQRIPLAEFPAEFKEANVVVGGRGSPEKQSGKTLSVAMVPEPNRLLEPHLPPLVREPIKVAQTMCEEMVYDGKGGWMGVGFFRLQPSYEACVKYCESHGIRPPYCLCDKYFKKDN